MRERVARTVGSKPRPLTPPTPKNTPDSPCANRDPERSIPPHRDRLDVSLQRLGRHCYRPEMTLSLRCSLGRPKARRSSRPDPATEVAIGAEEVRGEFRRPVDL